MAVREFINSTDFTTPEEAIDLYSSSVRRTLQFDVFQDQTVFEAIILSRPYFLVDAQISDESAVPNVQAEDEGRLSKFAFKARILGNPSPHDYLPDPCTMNAETTEEQSAIMRVVNLHTTFVSSDDYTRTDASLPNIGDKVRVELEKNVHSYNLQFGKFLSLADNTVGTTLSPEEACISTRLVFAGAANAALFANGAAARPVLTVDSFADSLENLPMRGGRYPGGSAWGFRILNCCGPGWHDGIDIPNGYYPAYSLCDGTVYDIETTCPQTDPCHTNPSPCTFCGGGNGNYVKIRCYGQGDQHKIIYAHLQSVVQGIEEGTRVIQGMQIGVVGDSGHSFGAHIHFEFRVNGASTSFMPPGGRNNAENWTDEQKETAHARGTPAEGTDWPSTHHAGRNRPNRYLNYYRKRYDDSRLGNATGETSTWHDNCRNRLAGKTTMDQINAIIKFDTHIRCKDPPEPDP